MTRQEIFQSTLPVWGATQIRLVVVTTISNISIHAPRVGSDGMADLHQADRPQDFNPRSPCGERLT